MNIESGRKAWTKTSGASEEHNGRHLQQSIRRVRLRTISATVISSVALLAVASGMVLVASGGLDVLEIIAWGVVAATLVTLIGMIVRAHGVLQTRQLRVLDHVEASLARTIRVEQLIRNLRVVFWVPMLVAFVLLAAASDYRHWTDYTFAATSIGLVIWGLVYGRDCVLGRIEADRRALQEQASRLRQMETEENAQ